MPHKYFSLYDFEQVLFQNKKVVIDPTVIQRMNDNHNFLKQFSSNKLIYGINTGFGPMAQYKVNEDNLIQLQYNLIRSHAGGSGKLMEPLLVKSIMMARLGSFLQAYSGVHTDLTEVLTALINNDITPCIFEHGGVGASGDLVQLAHLALVLIGEGEVIFEGEIYPAAEIFKRFNITPLSIHIREGLAIINGTSAMTGIGMINVIQARKLLHWGILLSALTNEVVEAYDDHFSHGLNIVKHHHGQNEIGSWIRRILADSKLIRSRKDHLYHAEGANKDVFTDKVQEYYSLRCVTQVLGPVYDTLQYTKSVIENEVNSVNDNPVIDHEDKNVYHGGNFHGDYVSLEMDKLKIAMTRVAMLAERQLNYLLNDKLNQKFPPFANRGVLGFNFGMQGMQFPAVSTVAENQTLAYPMYLHSIPNNNDNQDIVSMGCNGALIARKVIDNSFEVLATQACTLVQIIEHMELHTKLASITKSAYKKISALFPAFIEDKARYKELRAVKKFLLANDPLEGLDNVTE